jgi:hypothetical protein
MKVLIVLALLWAVSAPSNSQDAPKIIITIAGVEGKNVIEEGVKPEELGPLTITANDGSWNVESFEIVHARGQSPVSYASPIKGNTFDASAMKSSAKSGDRLVIVLKQVTNARRQPVTLQNKTVVVPIK